MHRFVSRVWVPLALCAVLAGPVLSAVGCATTPQYPPLPAPPAAPAVQLKQDVLAAINVLDIVAHGIEGLVTASPPLLTITQANPALDTIKSAVRILQVTNSCPHALVTTVLTQLAMMPIGPQITPYVTAGRVLVGNSFWSACPTTRLNEVRDDGLIVDGGL